MFFKIGSVPILSVYQSNGKFSKCSQRNLDEDKAEEIAVKRAVNLISKDTLNAVSRVYNLSDNIDNYIFLVARAVTADVPNSNGDMFGSPELTRFSQKHRCQVYQTFRNDPLHVEHAADDPKTARGFLPDAYYVKIPDEQYVLTAVAVDTKKDSPLAEGILSGDINKFSMGCMCDSVQCSYSECGKIATSDHEMCDHLRWHKMSRINGELIFEKCLGVEYSELSVVGDPADITAQTQLILHKQAQAKELSDARKSFNALSGMLNESDQYEVARFFRENINKLPEAMLRLANKIL